MADPRTKIFDARFALPHERPAARDNYLAGHIPGALFFDLEEICDKGASLPHMLPREAQFSAAMRELGVDGHDLIIVYDEKGPRSAARAWWMLRVFGHQDVAILNGGFHAWRAEGRPIEAGSAIARRQGDFAGRFDPAGVRERQAMLANVVARREIVIDARAQGRFTGEEPDPWPGRRPGHIPNSLNLPFDRLCDPATGCLRSAAEIESLFLSAGLDMAAPTITTCGSGVTACVLVFALHLIGKDDVAVYDGSWAEWGLGSETPVATGAAHADAS